MSYSSLCDSQAREKFGISPYQELDLQLRNARERYGDNVFVVITTLACSRFRGSTYVVFEDSIDFLVNGASEATDLAMRLARQSKSCLGIARYQGQPRAQLQAELQFAMKRARRNGLQYCFYTLPVRRR